MPERIWMWVMLTQFLGVLLSFFGYGAWIYSRTTRRFDWVIFFAFIVPFLLLGVDPISGLVDDSATFWPTKDEITLLMCYIDIGCLTVLVFRTGGTRDVQSIFTPIFVVIPPISAAFLKHTQFGVEHVWYLIGFAVAGYVVNYLFAPAAGPPEVNERIYTGSVLIVMGGSMSLGGLVAFSL